MILNSAGPARSRPSFAVGDVVKLVAVGIAYYVAARLSLKLALVEKNVTPLWPPTGIAVVSLLILGRRVWPGIAIAAFLVNLPISTNAFAAAATAAGNTIAPVVAASLLERFEFRRHLDRLRDAIAMIFLGGLASMLLSASIGAGTLVLSNAIPAHRFLSAWAVWWAGDAMGVLVVAPFLLTLDLHRQPMSARARLELAGFLIVIAATTLGVMHTNLRLFSLVIPLLGWAAWRFEQRGAAPAALIVAGIASWAAAHGWAPFHSESLLNRMFTLQAFNATVAFSSFVFAALVTERSRARDMLERAAVHLEDRVRTRTAELRAANEQLAEAQGVAHVGSWEWLVPQNRVSWSDELFRIYGFRPQEFPVTFEKAMELVVEEDTAQIRANVEAALTGGRDADVPEVEYRVVRPDGDERILLGRAKLTVGPGGEPARMVGTVQDVTETKRAERTHRIAETLQRSLLPDRLPVIPGVELAARYVPATADMEVGGDWYDVVQLPNGLVGLAIGDVAGHGLRAASLMGQIRMALRAYALEETSPSRVMARIHEMAGRLLHSEIVTLAYLVFDPETDSIVFSNAGHPPPVVIGPDGVGTYLEGGLTPPLGAVVYANQHVDATAELPHGSTLLLYTDGLVERRGESIRRGLDHLMAVASEAEGDLEELCDGVLDAMVGGEVSDDIAVLALRPVSLAGERLRVLMPAEPNALGPLRQTLRRWLREIDAPTETSNEVLVACGEACANVVQHAYGAGEGSLEVELDVVDGTVEVTVRDRGNWRPPLGTEGGRGLGIMRGFMDDVDVDRGPQGTRVRMRRRIDRGADR
ncbi:MAG: MASE1 domain-containing protein [Actinomycetota bacterium]